MRIARSDAQRLVIVDFPWIFPSIFLPMAALLLALGLLALARALNRPEFPWFGTGTGRMWGCLLAGLLSAGAGLAFCVRSEFTFDLLERRLTWSRRSLLKSSGGVVPFEQVRNAFTDRSDGDSDTFSVTLRTNAGPLPLSPFYSSRKARFDDIRDAINSSLQMGSANRDHETNS